MNDFQNKTAEELAALVEYHNLRYWILNSPEISDAQYDLLVETLRRKDPASRLPDAVKGIEVSSSPIRHADPMLSLKKVYSFAELQNWCASCCRGGDEILVFTPKYDGVAGDWDGRILSTRGDGRLGNDISDKIKMITFRDCSGETPLIFCREHRRGEIIMMPEEFARCGGEFKTPRAAAAGLLGRNSVSENHALTFVDYSTHEITLSFRELAENTWQEICGKLKALPYPMDGIVISLADKEYGKSLGSSSHHPHDAVAFKFGSAGVWSRILKIHWQINRQDITPVAEIEPVELAGRTVSRVTLHNARYVQDEDICCGDQVEVILSGDVIPKIVGHQPGEDRRNVMISRCPSCGKKLSWRDSRLVCTNKDCEAVVKAMLLDFARKLKMKGFGSTGVDYLFGIGVRSREQMAEKLIHFRKYGFRSLPAPGNALEDILVKDIFLSEAQKLAACDVLGLGEVHAQTLCGKYSLETIFSHAGDEKFFWENLPASARCAVIAQRIGERRELFSLLEVLTYSYGKRGGNRKTAPAAAVSVPSRPARTGLIHADNIAGYPDLDLNKVRRIGNGELICLTGRMPWVRAELYQVCTAAGFTPVDRFNSSVSLVVYADISSVSRKLSSAARHGVPVEDILQFVNRINAIA